MERMVQVSLLSAISPTGERKSKPALPPGPVSDWMSGALHQREATRPGLVPRRACPAYRDSHSTAYPHVASASTWGLSKNPAPGLYSETTRPVRPALYRALPLLLLLASCDGPQPPNLILIMADDLGYETLGINGGLSYDTPNLDSLARAGLRFTHAFSTPLCTPTRVQIMTGKYSFRNYIGFGLLDPDERTFAHLLREAGYSTGIAGKWQLFGNAYQRERAGRGGSTPEDAGFDEFALWQVRERGWRFKAPTIHDSGRTAREFLDGYGPEMFTRFAEDFLERHRNEPFLLYYPMVLTHFPFQPTPDHADYSALDPAGGVDDPVYFASNVAYMDAIVGRITAKLQCLGLDRRITGALYRR